jgi:uncharacterized protein involved in high-affinity Fe2+ transport
MNEKHFYICTKTILSILIAATFAVKLPAADINAPAPLKIGTLEAANFYYQTMKFQRRGLSRPQFKII